jgi:hypothetical protein
MSDLVESLRDIQEDRYAVSIYFHIIVYSFNNFMYLLYSCMFNSKTKLIIGNQYMAVHYYKDPWE